MPFVPAPNCIQVEIRWILDSQHCENRFFVDVHTEPTPELINEASTLYQTWVEDEYAPLVNGAITFTELVITDWTRQLGYQNTTPLNIVGGTSGTMLPNETSFCVSLRTGLRGRSARGRWYMPPPDQASRAGINSVTPTYRNAAIFALQTLIGNTFDHDGWQMAVVQFVSNGTKLAAGVPHHFVVATAVDDTLDSQRRRKPGNGT